tara:strand:+ start:57 stop:482 length:426 start_codon:yes stop_codon:yes gene_type:complete
VSLGYDEIQSAISEQIELLSGFREALTLPSYFGRIQNTLAHKGFVVGLPAAQQMPERQRGILYVSSTVQVKFAFRLRPHDAYPLDYKNALLAEKQVTKQVLSSYESIKQGIQIRFESASREATDSTEYMIHTLNFIIFHSL